MFALAILAAVMGLMLFVPAGTVHYWQAWVYLSIFMSASALTTIDLMRKDQALLERRMSGGPMAEKKKVISTGPYAIVRHPMYAGGSLYLIGTPLRLARIGGWSRSPR